ncbi:MAG: beta-N-acetylhexosaminidase, partial [Rickettsiales bacterium]|nr:beta-N-acetylhexosaminidase [Rickettsiales bacterium]
FFESHPPYGFILFQKHCQSPQQVTQLVRDLRACVAHEAPVFIDMEGGRVARLKPPYWELFPAAEVFAEAWLRDPQTAEDACYANARHLAETLTACGINANCAPLADLRIRGAHDIIGDRAFGESPKAVIALGRAQANGLMDGGVYPVLKHIPGHGRALADSHFELPQVTVSLIELEQSDFIPFKALADLPFAMTAHITYDALDSELPATLSPTAIDYIRHKLGFKGLLMSDDISMKALQGDLGSLSKDMIAAGCDLVLLCHSDSEMRQQVAEHCGTLPEARMAVVPLLQAKPAKGDNWGAQCKALLQHAEHAIASA